MRRRQTILNPQRLPPINDVCPSGFGNGDIYAFTTV
jgi:hypothetical protein